MIVAVEDERHHTRTTEFDEKRRGSASLDQLTMAIPTTHSDAERPGLSVQQLVARYIYQIINGCDDPNCRAPFCLKNTKRQFLGRKVKKSATVALAFQLTGARGSSALCSILRNGQLPVEIAGWIDQSDPLKSRILETNEDEPSSSSLSSTLMQTPTLNGIWPIFGVNGEDIFNAVCHHLAVNAKQAKFLKSEKCSSLAPLLNPSAAMELFTTQPDEVYGEFVKSLAQLCVAFQGVFPLERFIAHVLCIQRHVCVKHDLTKAIPRIDLLLGTIYSSASKLDSYFIHLPMVFHEENAYFPPKNSMAALLCEASARRYLKYWPANCAYSTTFLGLHHACSFMEERNQAFRIGPGVPNAATAFFRRYRYAPTGAVYLTHFPYMLSLKKRMDIFRYGCLRQMAMANNRLSNLTLVMSKTEFFLPLPEEPLKQYTPSLLHVDYFIMDVDRNDFIGSSIDCIKRALLIENMVRRPLKIRFGAGELALDHGGVQIEYFQSLGYQLLYSGYGFFSETESGAAWFNPGYSGDSAAFEYLGMLFGIGIYNGCIIDINLPKVFYKLLKMPTQRSFTFEDVEDLFPDMAHSLQSLLDYHGDIHQDMMLSFEFVYKRDGEDEPTVVRLPSYRRYPEGAVTNENVHEYVKEYFEYKVFTSIEHLFHAFEKGFRYIIGDQLLNLFAYPDLKPIVEGSPEIDLNELEEMVSYSDGYTRDSPTIKYFWSVVHEFRESEKQQLLEFVTGSKRIPIGGMARLSFTIQYNGTDSTRLPSSSVCFSRLLLPEYPNQKQLKRMLLLALQHSQGFGLV